MCEIATFVADLISAEASNINDSRSQTSVFVRPKPIWHLFSSHFPAPFLSHESQLVSQAAAHTHTHTHTHTHMQLGSSAASSNDHNHHHHCRNYNYHHHRHSHRHRHRRRRRRHHHHQYFCFCITGQFFQITPGSQKKDIQGMLALNFIQAECPSWRSKANDVKALNVTLHTRNDAMNSQDNTRASSKRRLRSAVWRQCWRLTFAGLAGGVVVGVGSAGALAVTLARSVRAARGAARSTLCATQQHQQQQLEIWCV